LELSTNWGPARSPNYKIHRAGQRPKRGAEVKERLGKKGEKARGKGVQVEKKRGILKP